MVTATTVNITHAGGSMYCVEEDTFEYYQGTAYKRVVFSGGYEECLAYIERQKKGVIGEQKVL